MRSLPIRIRLTLWYFAMFASAAALLSLASLWMLRRSVDATEFHELQERTDDVRVLSLKIPRGTLEQISGDFAEVYSLKDDGKYLQVRDEKGHWIFRSKRMIATILICLLQIAFQRPARLRSSMQGIHHVRVRLPGRCAG